MRNMQNKTTKTKRKIQRQFMRRKWKTKDYHKRTWVKFLSLSVATTHLVLLRRLALGVDPETEGRAVGTGVLTVVAGAGGRGRSEAGGKDATGQAALVPGVCHGLGTSGTRVWHKGIKWLYVPSL